MKRIDNRQNKTPQFYPPVSKQGFRFRRIKDKSIQFKTSKRGSHLLDRREFK